ncbi:MAG: DNA helicase RecQ [Bacteroidota bacterium]|nr:DNA helicase RecQ [Bacteroidota bacterium]
MKKQDLVQQIDQTLKTFFGFNSFKGTQREVILSIIQGHNTFVIMPTGGGKSLCYQLPAIILDGTAIIISPLIALMKNQVDLISTFGAKKGFAHFLNSSLSKKNVEVVKDDLRNGRTKMLYVAPETLNKESTLELLKKMTIPFIAVDEAHCISEWGHDFRPEYRRVRNVIETIGKIPIIALTASATPKVQDDILKNLEIEDANVFKSSFDRPNLYYSVKPKPSNTHAVKNIVNYIKNNNGSGIIYCLTRKKTEELAETLQLNGINAIAYHAGMESSMRVKNQDAFLMEDVNVICATIAFGMGIDKPDIRYVIHFDVPKSIESYYQETGRAGRDGIRSDCILYYNYKDLLRLEKLFRDKPYYEREKANQLLNHTAAFCENSNCRREALLHYFGENYTKSDCSENKMCDNCRYPKEKFEGHEEILIILKLINDLGSEHKLEHIANIMIGESDKTISQHNHDSLEMFGAGNEHDFNYWKSIIRISLLEDLLEHNIENLGTLRITEKGKNFIKEPHNIEVAIDSDYSNIEDDDFVAKGGQGGYDENLFKMLKDVRKTIARRNEVPPYIVFQDPSLEEMAIKYPITKDELTKIIGVSETKAIRYGQSFLEVIDDYVTENNIERPEDLVVKSVINKSKNKVFIIQNIDKKISLEDISTAIGYDYEELLNEIEDIVYSGTKLNLNYFIDEVLDEDFQDEIFDYFLQADTDSLKIAYDKMGKDVYSIEELQLMRIKFISEMAN